MDLGTGLPAPRMPSKGILIILRMEFCFKNGPYPFLCTPIPHAQSEREREKERETARQRDTERERQRQAFSPFSTVSALPLSRWELCRGGVRVWRPWRSGGSSLSVRRSSERSWLEVRVSVLEFGFLVNPLKYRS